MPRSNFINETGNIYGKLTVIEPARPEGSCKTRWRCICECGNEIICNGSELRAGKRTSCGKHCNSIKKFKIGEIYSYLKILNRDPAPGISFNDHSIHWICECQLCGTIKSISGRLIRNGEAKSCGCLESTGERLISQILIRNNIPYIKEYTFDNLIGKNKAKYRFDFAILDNQNKLLDLIEYQGIQHFEETNFTKDNLKLRKERNLNKLEYCKKNHYNILFFNNKSKNKNVIPEQDLEEKILFFYNYIKEEKKDGKIFNFNY